MDELAPPECLFCRVVTGAVPAEIVAQSEHSVAFRDIDPKAPTHVLVIPRQHVADLAALADRSAVALADVVLLARTVASQDGLADYRLAANTGAAAGQSVFHAHLHVLGGRELAWPPG